MYQATAYPEGVPNPYRGAVHPYPSYEHGPDYTRPVFEMPYEPRPHNVLSGLGGPWLPQRNLVGAPTVQPQPNPYYPHWPQALGGIKEQAGRVGLAVAVAAAIGAGVGTMNQAVMNPDAEPPDYLWGGLIGAVGVMALSIFPILVASED